MQKGLKAVSGAADWDTCSGQVGQGSGKLQQPEGTSPGAVIAGLDRSSLMHQVGDMQASSVSSRHLREPTWRIASMLITVTSAILGTGKYSELCL